MSKFLIAVDESKEQTQRIIEYQNRRNAGNRPEQKPKRTIHFIQQLVRNLKHYEVINPYATKLNLPEKVHKIRRLNEIPSRNQTGNVLNQYPKLTKRQSIDNGNRDIEQATEILLKTLY